MELSRIVAVAVATTRDPPGLTPRRKRKMTDDRRLP